MSHLVKLKTEFSRDDRLTIAIFGSSAFREIVEQSVPIISIGADVLRLRLAYARASKILPKRRVPFLEC